MGATIPEPPKDDNLSKESQQYLKEIYEELKRDNTGTGLQLPTGAVFFMMTGSCPTGTTDVSATYSNKFIKVNATAGTSSGVVLTGTSDSHILTTDEIPSHTHPTNVALSGSGATNNGGNEGANGAEIISDATGGGGGHTHTLSTATTLEPSSVTCKMCQVD